MLEEAKNSLPEELAERFSMNRFFAIQRDVINDELQDNVPYLIEDALENPTGTYKQISRFQNEKLLDIDRTSIRIEQKLDNILGLVGKMQGGAGTGDGIFDDILEKLLKMMGLGALGRGLFGRKGKAPAPTTKSPKTKKPPGKFDKLKRIGGKVKTGGRAAIGAAIAGIIANFVYDMSSEEYSTEEAIDNLMNADYGEMAQDIAAYTAIATAAPAAIKLKSMLGAGAKPAPTVPTATPATGGGKVLRHELPKDHPKYLDKNVKGQGIKPYQYVSAEEARNYKPTSAPKAATAAPSAAGRFGKAAGGVLSGAARTATSKSTGLTATAYALYEFYKGVTSLPTNLSEEQYTLEVSKLGSAAVAEVGLFMFSTFVSSLIAGTIGAIAGGTAGGAAGAAAGGVGAAPGAAAGATAGAISAGIAKFVFDVSVYYAIDYFWGEELDEFAKNEEFNKVVAKVVYWLMNSYRTLKQGMDMVSEFVSGDSSTDNTGFRAKHLANKSGTSAKPTAKKTTPSSPMGTGGNQSDMQAATKAASQLFKDRKEETDSASSLDWFKSENILKSMAASPMFAGAAGGGAMAGILGMGSEAQAAFDKIGGNGITAASIFGGAGLAQIMNMAGAKAITPEDAVAMGLANEEDDPAVKQKAADSFNSTLTAQTSTAPTNQLAAQIPTVADNRATAPQLAKSDSTEELMNEMRQRDKQYAESMSMANRQTPAQPSITVKGFPQFASTPLPTSLAVVALRAQGMVDVYAHPQSGSTMERMDRGGETLLG